MTGIGVGGFPNEFFFYNITSGKRIDGMRWVLNSLGMLGLRSCYECLRGSTRNHIWGSKVASKVAFFAWTVALGKILKWIILLGRIWPLGFKAI